VPDGLSQPGPAATRSDRIELRGLRFVGRHGALPEESKRAQPFEVDLDLYVDLAAAAAADDLALTVDYGVVCEAARSVLEGEHARLLETLADKVAAKVLGVAGEHALAVDVVVRKLRPPLPYVMASAAAHLYREAPRRAAGVSSGEPPEGSEGSGGA